MRAKLIVAMGLVWCLGCNYTRETEKLDPGLSATQTKEVQAIAEVAAAKATKELAATIRGAIESARQTQQEELRELSSRVVADQERARLVAQHEQSKSDADDAKRRYDEDIRRAATLSPEEQMRLHEVNRKRASGERLTASELTLASRFHEFEDLVREESKRRAAESGIIAPFAQPGSQK